MYCIHLTTLTVAYGRNLMRLHRTTMALIYANLLRILFYMRLFRRQICRSHEYFDTSARAPIVSGPFR